MIVSQGFAPQLTEYDRMVADGADEFVAPQWVGLVSQSHDEDADGEDLPADEHPDPQRASPLLLSAAGQFGGVAERRAATSRQPSPARGAHASDRDSQRVSASCRERIR
jgi:hypothetical protein